MDVLTDLEFWKSNRRLSRLLDDEPMAYYLFSILASKQGIQRARFFLDGYKQEWTIEATVDVGYRTVEAEKISHDDSFVITQEDFNRLLMETVKFTRRVPVSKKFYFEQWARIMGTCAEYFSDPTLLGLFRDSIGRENVLFHLLQQWEIDRIIKNLCDVELKILIKKLDDSWIRRLYHHERIRSMLDVTHPRMVQYLRNTLASQDQESGESLSLTEMMKLIGFEQFTIDGDVAKVVESDYARVMFFEPIQKAILDRQIRDLMRRPLSYPMIPIGLKTF
jgi:hypothetical protein